MAVAIASFDTPCAFAESGITNVVNGAIVNYPSGYMVGTNGPFNALIVTNAGVMNVSGGNSYIGNSVLSSSNTVWVTGPGSRWNSGWLFVGRTGSFNQLIISNGGRVSAAEGFIGSSGRNNTVLVSGTGSRWSNGGYLSSGYLIVGDNASGNQLTITNGGQVVSTAGYVGFSPLNYSARSNAVLVSGIGSLWTNSGSLMVGDGSSDNRLIINNGGQVVNAEGSIGDNGWSAGRQVVLVSDAGSLWRNNGDLTVGSGASDNQLIITNGGQVFNATGWVGRGATSTNNAVLVSGAGSLWCNRNNLYVGWGGSGNQVSISNGGVVTASNVTVGYDFTAGTTLTVSGGSLYATNSTSTGALDVNNGSFTLNTGTVVVNRLYLIDNVRSVMTFSAGLLRSGGSTVSNCVAFTVGDGVQSATLDLLGGDHTFVDGLSISTNGNLVGNGNIVGSVTNFGVIAPGHSAGLLTFSGDLDLQDSSTLNFEIGGATTNDYDRVWVGGILRIGGLLNLILTNGYTGNVGDTFDLFNFGSLTGAFSQTNLPTLSAGSWDTSNLYTLGEIQIVPEPGISALALAGAGALWLRRRRR